MWFEFFRFDLKFQLRQPLLWVAAFILAALAFGATSSDAVQVGGSIGNINRNAPLVIAQLLTGFSLISMLIVTIFIAGSVLRDSELGMSDMIFATPMRKHDYLIGRFLAGFVACLAIFIPIILAMIAGPLMPWVDAARVGPFRVEPYIGSFLVFIVPNLLFISALLLLLAATTRSILLVYVGVLVFLVLWGVGGAFTRDIANEWLGVLLDPFGMRALSRTTKYFSSAEANTSFPPLAGFLMFNRLLWLFFALCCFIATLFLFKPQRAGTSRALWRGKQKKREDRSSSQPLVYLPRSPTQTPWLALHQTWHIFRFDVKTVFFSLPFLVMLLVSIVNFVASVTQSGRIFGTNIYPVTSVMLQTLQNSFNFMLIIIVSFYAGELVFKERQAKIADVIDAMPLPNWAPLVAKCLALVAVVFAFMGVGALAAACFQLIKGGAPIELGLYAKGVFLGGAPFILMGLIGVVLQVLTNNKFIGYFLVIVLMISQIVMGILDFDHNLYNFAGLPQLPYSDMNGYGHFLKGWGAFFLYWSLFLCLCLWLSQAFWVRGLSQDWRARCRAAWAHIKGPRGAWPLLLLIAWVAMGSWIFYQTNILNRYLPSDKIADRQAQYEKLYKQYKGMPLPKITAVQADVDIFPYERRVLIQGQYTLQNKQEKAIDTLYLQLDPDVSTQWLQFPEHEVILDDKDIGFKILKLKSALQPQALLNLAFRVEVQKRGFTNSGSPDLVFWNGTFFNNSSFFPHFGYQSSIELQDRSERRKRGLGEPERMAKLEDKAALSVNTTGPEADWIDFDTTVSTSSDQIAMAPGYLQKTWEKDGRRYFHYKMDKPILNFFSYLSARWEVKKGDWQGIPIEIYYDKKHAYNVDRMIYGTQKSLDYFSAQFTPYQFRQVRILEFPQYQVFAQSFANTIPFSEGIGFIADLRDPEDIDYVFYVTAHEVAHQWWGHQFAGADVQGSTMLVESLAQYSAMMVMEKEYGRDKIRRYLQYELDRYLSGRGGELIEELPLFKVENQTYIHYRKGSLVFYRLRDEIGEEALNRALKKFLELKQFEQAPYSTSQELINMIRAEAPADKQSLITDLFEKIIFYDNRVSEAKAVQNAEGKWELTVKVKLTKLEADGKGAETKLAYEEPIELVVFARDASQTEQEEKVILQEKRQLPSGESTFTLTVPSKPYEVGIDPYNKLIDRVARDNRKTVSFE